MFHGILPGSRLNRHTWSRSPGDGSCLGNSRYPIPDIPQHVIQRGNNRQPVFFADDDYRFYLACLQHAAEQHTCAVHAYVLMTNHVHLLVTPSQANGVIKLMQSIGRRYVQYVNATYQRTGTSMVSCQSEMGSG